MVDCEPIETRLNKTYFRIYFAMLWTTNQSTVFDLDSFISDKLKLTPRSVWIGQKQTEIFPYLLSTFAAGLWF